MTIDERLERLTDRHEALAQSVEMLRDTVHETSANIAEVSANVAQTDRTVAALSGLIEKTLDAVGILAESVKSHERRLELIEGNA